METPVYRFRVDVQKMEIFEFDDAIHHTAQALCKVICVSPFHFCLGGRKLFEYGTSARLFVCSFNCSFVLFCFVLFFEKKSSFSKISGYV